MLFIFGWNHKKNTDFGPVEEHSCQNCNNTRLWNLTEISAYFTLFFIPLFAHDKERWLLCPVCTFGIKLDKEDFLSYKSIAEINSSFNENRISEAEKNKLIAEVHQVMDKRYEDERAKEELLSTKWESLVAEKTDEELLKIINSQRAEFSLAFLIAAEKEADKRKIR